MVGNHWARQTEFWVRSFPTANNLAGVPATGARSTPGKHWLCQHYMPGAELHTSNKLYRRQTLAQTLAQTLTLPSHRTVGQER